MIVVLRRFVLTFHNWKLHGVRPNRLLHLLGSINDRIALASDLLAGKIPWQSGSGGLRFPHLLLWEKNHNVNFHFAVLAVPPQNHEIVQLKMQILQSCLSKNTGNRIIWKIWHNLKCENAKPPLKNVTGQRRFRSSNFRLYWKLPVGLAASMLDSRDVLQHRCETWEILAGRNCAKGCVFP